MATVTKGRTFVSGEVVTPTKLNTLVDTATVTGIVNSDIDAAAAIADTKLATIATAGKIANTATTATSANTASSIVARDASGNFSAGTITANAFAGTGATLLVPTGAVMPFAMNSAPSGWLPADGGQYLKTGTYAALFAAIGVIYGETNGSGGTGTTHFRVPDLRGEFLRGWDNGRGIDTGRIFGSAQAQRNDHTHGIGNYVSGGPSGISDAGLFSGEIRPRNVAMLYCIKF